MRWGGDTAAGGVSECHVKSISSSLYRCHYEVLGCWDRANRRLLRSWGEETFILRALATQQTNNTSTTKIVLVKNYATTPQQQTTTTTLLVGEWYFLLA